MRLKLFIATIDILYAKLISDNISEFHADKIDVSTCSSPAGLQENLSKWRYDVALIDPELIEYANTSFINLPLILWSETDQSDTLPDGFGKISKYQRISSIVASILEIYAKVSKSRYSPDSKHAEITAIWSPAGGVGKTSVALAYAMSKIPDGKEVFYLNLEDFTSVPGFFRENGKSISTIFEMFENRDGNVKMLIQGVVCRDQGISYLCGPENYEDMSILSSENVNDLIINCAGLSDELVIDLPNACDIRTRKAFELADKVMLVTDKTTMSKTKLAQFISQNNVYESIKEKVTLIANKGVKNNDHVIDMMVSLPFVQSEDVYEVCRVLSESLSKQDISGSTPVLSENGFVNRKAWLQA